MIWPLTLRLPDGILEVPGPGRYELARPRRDADLDALLDAGRAALDGAGVGWLPGDGGLLGNLPGWENLLLFTQWHAPAGDAALEVRLRTWLALLGIDERASRDLLARVPSRMDADERRLTGWLRQLLARPRLILLEGSALPGGPRGAALDGILAEELAGCALVVVDGDAPRSYLPLHLVEQEPAP